MSSGQFFFVWFMLILIAWELDATRRGTKRGHADLEKHKGCPGELEALLREFIEHGSTAVNATSDTVVPQSRGMPIPKWQYRTEQVCVRDEDMRSQVEFPHPLVEQLIDTDLNHYGEEGWELAGFLPGLPWLGHEHEGPVYYYAVFKRASG